MGDEKKPVKPREAVMELVRSVTKLFDGQVDHRVMFQVLMTVAASHADAHGVCEKHFVAFARTVYSKVQNPIIECETCGQKNRLRSDGEDPLQAICGVCKSPLLESALRVLDDEERPASPPNSTPKN